jgi:hypothetical protein
MAEFIEFLSPSALADLKKGNDELLLMIKNVDVIGQKMSKINTPSGSDSAIKDLNAKLLQQEASYARLQIQLEKYTQAQNRTKISNNQVEKSNISLEASIERKNKAIEREQAKLEASQNVYNKVQQKLNALQNEYKALAVQKELTGKLTDKESQRYDFLAGKITKYDTTLKAVDASMGKYQRNVGNYASAFNPLGNSINQLTREMPAFANSVQTGFMAISNNLPIFFDSMQQIINQNKELQAQGQPTKSVLSQLSTALFSWGTALSVGVTLLTIYGKELVTWIGNLTKGSEALDEITKRQKEFNSAKQSGRKDAQTEIIELQKYLAVVKDEKLSMEQRQIALKALRTQYPFYFKNLKDAQILAGQSTIAEKELTIALEKRKEVEKKTELNVANRQKLIDLNAELDAQKKLEVQAQKLFNIENAKPIIADRATAQANRQKLVRAEENLNSAKSKSISIQKDIDAITKQTIKNDTDIIRLKKETIGLEYQDTKAKKENTKAKRENLEAVNLTVAKTKGLIDVLEEQKSQMQELQRLQSKNNKEWKFYQERIDQVQKAIDYLTKGNTDLADSAKKATDQFQKMHFPDGTTKQLKEFSQYLQGFINDFASSTGFTQTFDILQGRVDGFGKDFATTFVGIAESAQEAMNFITQNMGDNFAEQYAMLEKQKNVEMLFAGDTASAKANIEEQYEERKRAIANKEAQAKKKQAIFNIAIDTAQAVVATLAKTPPPAGLPLAALVATLGGIQIALVNSQEVPQFYKGTDNAPEGLAFTQEKGREIITDKSGKIKSYGSDKGAQLTYLNKGDKVFTAEKSSMMFNENLNSILTSNGIDMPKIQINNHAITDAQINRIVDTIANKETANLNIDKSGLNFYVSNGHSTKQRMNNRVTFKGQSV